MSRFVETKVAPKDDLDLLAMVSRYHQVMSNPALFQDIRQELDNRLADLDVRSKALDEKQAQFTAETAEAVKRHNELIQTMKSNAQVECQSLLEAARAEKQELLEHGHRVLTQGMLQKSESERQAEEMVRSMKEVAEAECRVVREAAENKLREAEKVMADARALMNKAMKAIEISNVVNG